MTRRIVVLVLLCAAMITAYFGASRWLIHHQAVALDDIVRDRPVTVDIAVRRDREMAAMAEMIELPVAMVSHGNTVKHTEYSFLTNALAARGYLVVSIQHDLDTDEPMVTKVGEEFVGRRSQYNRDIANVFLAIEKLKHLYPNADFHHLTMVGHSNGGDVSMYFAKRHPDLVRRVVTLDNLRVPFATDGKVKILSFRSKDPVFKADPGVVPDDELCARLGIKVIKTDFQHNDMSDRGSDRVRAFIEAKLYEFLDGDESATHPAKPDDTRVVLSSVGAR